jgi:replication factor C subunit 3/5
MSSDGEIPHLLFYGPEGAGKKTRVNCLLREIFGPGVDKLRLDTRTFTTPSKKQIEVNMISSNFHIEMNPSDAGIYDRYVVGEVIKEIAQNHPLHSQGKGAKGNFKVVVLNEVDKLSKQAQAGLRRTMEKYTSVCRLILCCSNQSKVIEPLRSRTLGLRVPAPTEDDVCNVLRTVCSKEGISASDLFLHKLAVSSGRNMRRATLMLEACKVKAGHEGLSDSTPVVLTDWEAYIVKLAQEVTSEQSPQKLLAAREKLYELLVNCIPSNIILKTLTRELMKNVDDELKHEVMEWAAFYDHRLSQGSKDIFHLEAFVAKFMAIYKAYLTTMFA